MGGCRPGDWRPLNAGRFRNLAHSGQVVSIVTGRVQHREGTRSRLLSVVRVRQLTVVFCGNYLLQRFPVLVLSQTPAFWMRKPRPVEGRHVE